MLAFNRLGLPDGIEPAREIIPVFGQHLKAKNDPGFSGNNSHSLKLDKNGIL
jgi:hypothetical protein